VQEEEEEQEVLVEDFDGECCRTYPYNHSRILRYFIQKKSQDFTEFYCGASYLVLGYLSGKQKLCFLK
jgi:hypothetical protein